jgi:phage repressor protein C with HTH and peptisase S24 domain
MLGRDKTLRPAPILGIGPTMYAADMDASDLRNNRVTATLLDNSARRVHGAKDCGNRNAASSDNCGFDNRISLRLAQNGGMDAEWIRKQLTKPGKSQAGLARHLGLNPSQVNRILSGNRLIKLNEVEAIQQYFGEKRSSVGTKLALHTDQPVINDDPNGLLKVVGMAEGGPEGWNIWNGDIIQYITRPANLVGVAFAYAVYVTGTSMEPRYHAGETVHIHPGKPILPGAYVLVQRKPKGPGEPPLAVIKRLVRRSGNRVILEQYNPPKTFEIKADDIVSIHRIVGSSES